MLDQQPKYEKYKDSGVPWIGDVPEDWQVLPGRACLYENKEKNTGMKEKTVLSLSYGTIRVKPLEEQVGLMPESYETYQIVRPGDIIIRGTDLQNDVTSLRTGLAKNDGIITSAYINLRPRPNVSPYYLHYLLHSCDLMKVFYGLGSGLRQNLSYEDFKYLDITVPDLDTQHRIVGFLDEKTAEIDAAIAKKRRLIDLLNEQKAILINRAVTKGLNPDAPKDSGVDWIGEIPAHWEVKRFKHCVKTQSGQVDPTKQPYKEMILIAPNHIVQGTGETLDFETADEQGADSGKYFAEAGSVIYSKIRPNLNKACIVDFDALCSADMYALRGYPKYFEQQYLLRQILSDCFVIPAVDASMRVAMPKVNREAMAEFPMIIPPKSEQSEIIEWLDTRLAEVRAPQVATEREISTLNEFKQTLIANAVTGKIRI